MGWTRNLDTEVGTENIGAQVFRRLNRTWGSFKIFKVSAVGDVREHSEVLHDVAETKAYRDLRINVK